MKIVEGRSYYTYTRLDRVSNIMSSLCSSKSSGETSSETRLHHLNFLGIDNAIFISDLAQALYGEL